MNWFRKIFPTKNTKIFLEVADKCFNEVCSGVGNSSAAKIYGAHPDVRDKHWKEIREDFATLVGNGNDPNLTKRLRGKWVEQLEHLVGDHFYTNLEEADRDVFAQYSQSDRASEDESYYWSIAYHYTYASLLDAVILGGWDGQPGSKEQLTTLKDNYIASCQDWCKLVLEIAWKKHDGIAVTEDDKKRGKTIDMFKEAERRALAGEKIFDDE